MIIDKLENIRTYEGSFRSFSRVFDYIMSIDLQSLAEGKHQMPDELGFIGIDKVSLRNKNEAFLESHRKYIDIQIPFNNIDTMGWKSVSDCKTVRTPYNDEKDIVFYSDVSDCYVPVKSGQFIIFFPGDAHAPLIGDGAIHKAIIKVKI